MKSQRLFQSRRRFTPWEKFPPLYIRAMFPVQYGGIKAYGDFVIWEIVYKNARRNGCFVVIVKLVVTSIRNFEEFPLPSLSPPFKGTAGDFFVYQGGSWKTEQPIATNRLFGIFSPLIKLGALILPIA